jgi:putative DNA primase/helicase
MDVDGPAGEARLSEMSKGNVPITLEFTSGRANGGRGLLYKTPNGITLRTTVHRPGQAKQELRFQAKGAQTVLPPSRHPEGCLYAWVPGRSPFELEPAIAPAWILEQLRADAHDSRRATDSNTLAEGEKIREGHRDDVLTSWAGTMRRRGFSRQAIEAALLIENALRCDPPLDEAQVKKIATSVGTYEPAPITRTRRRSNYAAFEFTVEV